MTTVLPDDPRQTSRDAAAAADGTRLKMIYDAVELLLNSSHSFTAGPGGVCQLVPVPMLDNLVDAVWGPVA